MKNSSKAASGLLYGVLFIAAGVKPLVTGRAVYRLLHAEGWHVRFVGGMLKKGSGPNGAKLRLLVVEYGEDGWIGDYLD